MPAAEQVLSREYLQEFYKDVVLPEESPEVHRPCPHSSEHP
jgi:hypothetical protein